MGKWIWWTIGLIFLVAWGSRNCKFSKLKVLKEIKIFLNNLLEKLNKKLKVILLIKDWFYKLIFTR